MKEMPRYRILLIRRRSFLAGILPLSLSLTPSRLRFISTVGMGVLVGTSLIVIIPEGVETLYSAHSKSHTTIQRHLSGGSIVEARWPTVDAIGIRKTDPAGTDTLFMPGPVIADKSDVAPTTPTLPGVVGIMEDEKSGNDKDKDGDNQGEGGHHDESHHAWMGIALIGGFILMYLVDKLPAYMTPSKPHTQPYQISLSNLGRRFNQAAPAEESDTFLDGQTGEQGRGRSFATTTGLVIHAAADGIALGASSSASNTGLSFIIFFAIMVHKAPAAFGLTSVLLRQGLSKRSARSHLLLFSLAAPTGALLTWVTAHALGVGDVESAEWWTGMLLLFSGGTFLYVAMHTMQESGPGHEPHLNGHANGSIDGRESLKTEQESSVKDLLAALFGMILPLFLQVGHAH